MSAEEFKNKGDEALKREEYEEAIGYYTSAITLDPDFASAYFSRGNARSILKHYEEAIADYDRAIALNPDSAGIYNNRGVARQKLKHYEEAIADYDCAIALNPEYAGAYFNRGNARDNLRHYKEAMTDYNRAIVLNPDNASVYHHRGITRHKLKNYEEAVADYDRAIALNPENASVYHYRGITRHKLKNYEEAIADYDRAIMLNPDYVLAYTNRGIAKDNLEYHEEAIADYDRAIALDPHNAVAYFNRGFTKLTLKDFPEVYRDYTRYVYLSRNDMTHLPEMVPFFRDHTDTPMIGKMVYERVPVITEIIHFQDYIEQCLLRVQPFEFFFMYRQAEDASRVYLLSRSLVNYYLGDEAAAFTIIDREIDEHEERLTYAENYYYAFSARSIGIIYGISPENILSQWPACEDTGSPESRYYLAWHHWLSGDSNEAIKTAGQNLSYLPSRYQLLFFTEDSEIAGQILQIEEALGPEKGFLYDFKRTIHPNEADYLSKFLDYAHYRELEEAIRMIHPGHVPKPLDKALEIDFVQLHKDLVREKAEELLKELLGQTEAQLQHTEAAALAAAATGKLGYLTQKFRELETLSENSRNTARNLELELAEFIYDYHLKEELKRVKMKNDSIKYYEKVIRYFYLRDKISLLTYLSLYYYLQQRGRILGEELLDKGSEAVLMDVAKKFTATGASSIPGVLAVGTFGFSVATIAVGLAGTYLATTGVHKLIKFVKEYGVSDRGAREDYSHFKAFFMENTIEALLDIKTEGFIASKTRKVLEDFYNEYQYVLKAQSSG